MIYDSPTTTDVLEILYILHKENPKEELLLEKILMLDRFIQEEDRKRRHLKRLFRKG